MLLTCVTLVAGRLGPGLMNKKLCDFARLDPVYDIRIMKRTFDYITAMFLVAASGVSDAASFDCAKAATKTEKLICGDAELSKLDEQLSAAYREALVKGANKDSVKQWQKRWLFFTRDDCPDVPSLKKAYTSHIVELQEHSAVASSKAVVSGKYERFYRGKPDKHSATVNIFELEKNRVRIVGSAVWVGNADTGNVNLGEIDGVFPLKGNKVHYSGSENDSCRLTITFIRDALIVSDDNSQCGGLNVSFNGEYQSIRGKK